ncbi:MAG: hypothetical protein ACTSYM_06490 [Candidatus Baldrarchaeia archaeon]
MSSISDLLLSLKKNKTTLTELKEAFNRNIDIISRDIDSLTERLERLKNKFIERQNIEEEKEKTVSELEAAISSLESEKTQAENKLSELKENEIQFNQQLKELETELAKTREEISSVKENISSIEQACKEKEDEIAKLEKEIENIKMEHDKAIASLRSSYEKESNRLNELKAKYSALKFLIRKNILDIPELKVIRVIKDHKTTSVSFIEKSTSLKTSLIQHVVKGLAERGVIEFNPNTGEIKTLKEIKI